MSALGHKQTFAAQKGMSALPPIATAKADIKSPGSADRVKFGSSAARLVPQAGTHTRLSCIPSLCECGVPPRWIWMKILRS
jgi:hypothetical protein